MSTSPNKRSRYCFFVAIWFSSARDNISSLDNRSSSDIEKNFAITFKDSMLGYPFPDSHFEIAVLET